MNKKRATAEAAAPLLSCQTQKPKTKRRPYYIQTFIYYQVKKGRSVEKQPAFLFLLEPFTQHKSQWLYYIECFKPRQLANYFSNGAGLFKVAFGVDLRCVRRRMAEHRLRDVETVERANLRCVEVAQLIWRPVRSARAFSASSDRPRVGRRRITWI